MADSLVVRPHRLPVGLGPPEGRVCTGTGLPPATSDQGLGSPCHVGAGTGLAPATSAPGLAPATSAPGLAPVVRRCFCRLPEGSQAGAGAAGTYMRCQASVRRPELATFTSAAALEDLLRKLDLTPAETERHVPG